MASLPASVSNLPIRVFKPGSHLIVEGRRENRLFFLVSGNVSVRKGDNEVAAINDKGAIFGEMSALLGIPATATVLAVDEVHAHMHDEADRFLEQTPDIAMHRRVEVVELHGELAALLAARGDLDLGAEGALQLLLGGLDVGIEILRRTLRRAAIHWSWDTIG